MSEQELTQTQVDQMVQEARNAFNEKLEKSGKTRTLFIASSKNATQMFAEYEHVRQQVLEMGFDMPPMFEDVEVKLS